MSNIDYERKAKILASGLCKEVKQLDKDIYNHIANGGYEVAMMEMFFCGEHNCSLSDLDEARRINQSNLSRSRRLRDRIALYLSYGECKWVTLTFDDDTLSKTSAETRRRYVQRFLLSQGCYYVANIDYGKENGREHYHAIVVADFIYMNEWKYGFVYTETIKNHTKSATKLAKYVSKLTNHAIKETTRRSVYLYSRSV